MIHMIQNLVHLFNQKDLTGETILSSGASSQKSVVPIYCDIMMQPNSIVGEAELHYYIVASELRATLDIPKLCMTESMWLSAPCLAGMTLKRDPNDNNIITKCEINAIFLDPKPVFAQVLGLKDQNPFAYQLWKAGAPSPIVQNAPMNSSAQIAPPNVVQKAVEKYEPLRVYDGDKCMDGGPHQPVQMVYSSFCKKCNANL